MDPVSGLLWGFGNYFSACALAVNRPVRGCRHPSDNQGLGETFVFVVVSTELVEYSCSVKQNKDGQASSCRWKFESWRLPETRP